MREIVVSATPEETRVVVLEGRRAVEIHVERSSDRSLVGDVYLGKVDRVLPGMQSAFVDVGLARHAFLHVSDVLPPDAEPERAAAARIEDLLRPGSEIVVQVTREPMGTKGARVTTHVTLPGKYAVFMPLSDHLGISKRISDDVVRERLRRTFESLRERVPGGVIVRTDAVDQSEEALEAELRRLAGRWQEISVRGHGQRAPARLHSEPGLAVRVLRDALASEVSRIVIDDPATAESVRQFAEAQAPHLAPLVQRHSGGGLLESLGLEQEIEKALRQRTWLKSGGYIVVDQLEALVAIDVNTGKFTGSRGLEETALQTNLEAAREIPRQLRLRDLGGIVVVDFIDMTQAAHRDAVLAELSQALGRDRARTTVLGMSEFGLVQLTRQRQKRSLDKTLLEPCPQCQGSGRVKSAETVATAALRQLRSLDGPPEVRGVRLRAHPRVADLVRRRAAEVEGTPSALPMPLDVVDDPERPPESFEITRS